MDSMPPRFSSFTRAGLFGFRQTLRDVSNLLYPRVCAFCHRELDRAETPGARAGSGSVCAACRARLVPPVENACLRCGAPLGRYVHSSPTGGCSHCRKHPFAFQKLIRLGTYRGDLRRACLRIKRANGAPLAAALAELLVEREGGLRTEHYDLVIPIPQHWLQRIKRPHNPAATLATVLSRRLKLPLATHILAKARDTRSQKRLTPTERRANLQHAFRVSRSAGLRNARVLLVDDILTTGATASEAARTLRRAAARSITVAVVGRVLATADVPTPAAPPETSPSPDA